LQFSIIFLQHEKVNFSAALHRENTFTDKYIEMKKKLHFSFLILMLFLLSGVGFAQTVNLGSAASYALYSTGGAVTNGGTIFKTRITGDVGTSSDPTLPGFGNIDGNITDVSDLLLNTQLDLDVLSAYNDLSIAIPTFFPAPLLGNGQILVPGVYDIAGPTVLNLELILDGQNDPNSIFILKIGGAFSSNANAKVKLINGALACNVYWKVEGLVSLATGTSMKGTIVANNAAIVMSVGDTLEGRAIAIEGAITVTEFFAYLPTGCGSPTLTGPTAPNLGVAGCFALFSSNGVNTNAGITHVIGDVGTNGPSDLTTGYDPLLVSGDIHPIPDLVTNQAATDLLVAYNYLVSLDPGDIELLRPDLFGHNLVLTPHTYIMLAAVTFTDTVYLDARGNNDAVFIINVNGAFSSNANSRVVLINGAQAKNVYWKVDGVVTLDVNSIFNGTLVVAGAINLNTGVQLNGRALTISGALNAQAITAYMPTLCSPEITTSPSDQLVCLGDAVSFDAVATGVGLSYQWRRGLINLVDGARISGSNGPTLTIDPTQLSDAGTDYNVIVSGTFSPSVTSNNVELAFNLPPLITTQPTTQTVCLGDLATFEVIASGTGLTYQWRKGLVNVVDNASISGSQTATLTIDPTTVLDAATNYNVVISGTCPASLTSVNVSLILNTGPVITTQPTTQTVCVGDAATFAVLAGGTGITYQWRKGLVNLVDNASISGSQTATLTIDPTTALDAGTNYNVVVSGTCPTSVTSVNVSLILNTAPVITTQPTTQTVCEGDAATFAVLAGGTGITYQWRKGLVNLVDNASISGSQTATLTIDPTTALDAGTNYNVVVSGTCPSSVTSVNVSLILNTVPVITTQPTTQTVCEGDAATFAVLASGTGLTYQWRKGLVNLADNASISGSQTATLTIDPTTILDAGTNYNVVVSGTCPTSVTSVNVSLILNTAPVITTQPTTQTVCVGDAATFAVLASGTGITYQWRKGLVNVVDNASISGSQTATLTIDPTTVLDAATNYNVVVSGTCPASLTSVNVSLILNTAPVITTQPTTQTVCEGDAATFAVLASGTGITYQWRKGLVNLVDNASISGSQTATLTIDPTTVLDAGTNYNVVVSGTCPTSVTSVNVSLILNTAPVITTQPTTQTVCEGDAATFAVLASGTGITYQWRKGLVNLVDNASISGSQTTTLTIDPTTALDAGTNYNVVVSGTCPTSVTSVDVSLIVNSIPVAIAASNSVVCDGNSILLSTITLSNASYSWTGPNGFTSNEQNPIITNSDTTDSGTYSLTVTVLSCVSVTSDVIVVVDNCDSLDFFIPEGFSPNNDGINDLFVIRGIQFFPNNNLLIFNRWGNKVFEANGYLNTWDGTSSFGITVGTDELPVGTYFYILDLGDGSDVYKGTIYLNR
jgi:gliding motility-associated-like protein